MTRNDFARHCRKVHLDLHLPENLPGMFERFDARAYVAQLRAAHVNNVALFAYCHHGNCYYHTQIGHKHEHLQGDYLGELAAECRANDIAALAYFSVAWNERMGREHPEWMQVDHAGQPLVTERFWPWICLNSPYRDFIYSLVREVGERYPVDGMWFDITYVAGEGCYCPTCQALYREQHGTDLPVRPAPGTPEARDLYHFRNWSMTRFRSDAVRLIKGMSPDFLVSWNHAGDMSQCYLDNDEESDIIFRETHTPENYLPSFQMRWDQQFGRPFEGCTSRFHYGGWSDFTYKHETKLLVETATAIAHGAVVDIGDQGMPDGTLDAEAYRRIGIAYGHVRAVEEHCLGTTSVPNVAVLHSSRSHHLSQWLLPHETSKTYYSVLGAARMLTEGHRHFDILSERRLDRLGEYHAVVLPDQMVLTPDEVDALEAYVRQGGALVATYRCGMYDESGAEVAPEFLRRVCGVEPQGLAEYTAAYLHHVQLDADLPQAPLLVRSPGIQPRVAGLNPLCCRLVGAESRADLVFPVYERSREHFFSHNNAPPAGPSGYPALTVHRLGAGTVVYSPVELAKFYWWDSYYPLRNVFLAALDLAAPNQEVYAQAPAHVEVVYRQRAGERFLHLLNYGNLRFGGNTHPVVTEEVVPVHGVTVRVRGRVRRAELIGEGEPPRWECEGGYTRVVVPVVDLHIMLRLEF